MSCKTNYYINMEDSTEDPHTTDREKIETTFACSLQIIANLDYSACSCSVCAIYRINKANVFRINMAHIIVTAMSPRI